MKQYKSYQKPQVIQQTSNSLLVYKPVGLTPLETVKEIQLNNHKYKDTKIGYAGRLDPMAEGLLLLLLGEENKNKLAYEQMDKEYNFECTFGIKTDTLDVLGIIAHVNSNIESHTITAQLQDQLSSLQGNIPLQYPIYSAKRVSGKPLYYWARKNKLDEITIPSGSTTIHSIHLNNIFEQSGKEISESAIQKIKRVSGDFRQNEIIQNWEMFGDNYRNEKFTTANITANVSSGTYIRSICDELGNRLSSGAIATSILRTKIGKFNL